MECKQILVSAAVITLSVFTATGQVPARALQFEAASVKSADPLDAGPLAFIPASVAAKMGFEGGPGTKDPGRIRYHGVSLQMLLAKAYNINPNQISGPPWLESEHYTIEAILPPGTDADQFRLMLRALLTERFRMDLHREVRQTPVYRLKVAKNGPKLMPPGTEPEYQDDDEQKAALKQQAMDSLQKQIEAMKAGNPNTNSSGMRRATTAKFAEWLSSSLDRPVLDMTQLEGEYHFKLDWTTEDALPTHPTGISIFTAVQDQLGLKLEAGNEQIELLVIDKAEKTPTGN